MGWQFCIEAVLVLRYAASLAKFNLGSPSAVGIASCRCGSMVLTLLCQTDVNITSLQMSKRQSLFKGLFCYPASTGPVPTRSRQPMATPPSEVTSNSLHCRRPCQLAKPRMLLNPLPRPRGRINWNCLPREFHEDPDNPITQNKGPVYDA